MPFYLLKLQRALAPTPACMPFHLLKLQRAQFTRIKLTGAQLSDKPQPAMMRWLSPNGWAALRDLQASAAKYFPDNKLLGCMKAKV